MPVAQFGDLCLYNDHSLLGDGEFVRVYKTRVCVDGTPMTVRVLCDWWQTHFGSMYSCSFCTVSNYTGMRVSP